MPLLKNTMARNRPNLLILLILTFVAGCSFWNVGQREKIKLASPIVVNVSQTQYIPAAKEVTLRSTALAKIETSPRLQLFGSHNRISLSPIQAKNINVRREIRRSDVNVEHEMLGIELLGFGNYPGLSQVQKVELLDIGTIYGLAERQGVKAEILSEIYRIASADGIPPIEVSYVFKITELNGVPLPYIVKVMRLAIAQNISIGRLIEFLKEGETQGVGLGTLVAAMNESMLAGVPLKAVMGIVAISQSIGCEPQRVVKVYAEGFLEKTPAYISPTLFMMNGVYAIETIDINIAKVAMREGVSVARLRIEAMSLALAIWQNCKPIRAVQQAMPLFKSRWQLFSPQEYTELWEIKQRAEQIEKDGGNTDELWRLFWDKLMSCEEDEILN